jgi:phosphate transport system substrate-binding protein
MFKREFTLAISMMAVTMISVANAQSARDYVSIAGSATISPLAAMVGEHFSQTPDSKPLQIQSIGTGSGFKLFCAGMGIETPDIATAVRPISPTEKELCEKNGIKDVIEIKFGYDAVVVVQSAAGKKFDNLTRKELFLAMAKDVPDPKDDARLVPNPYKTWKDINPTLPDVKIQIWAPAAMHGTHDAILSQIMLVGCKQFGLMQTLQVNDLKAFETVCQTFRGDGVYVEFKEYDAALQEMKINPNTQGIIGYTLLYQNPNLKSFSIDSNEPRPEVISHEVYPLVQPMLLYVKKSHLDAVPGLKGYLTEFTSEDAIGTRGYLPKIGMVPLPLAERNQTRASVAGLSTK